ncbi:MAG: NADPH:quinone reductase [Pseudomonadota bacterium]
MRAAIYTEIGDAADVLKIVDTEAPKPGAGEVLVRIYASGVNPADTKTRSGVFPLPEGWSQIIPHNDGAGVIDAVGAGVDEAMIGKRVWLHTAQWGGVSGTAAEYAVTRSDRVIELPKNVDFSAGATFGVPLLTARNAVLMNGPVRGKTVLVQGGAGAVGGYAIQIAKAKGARVIATVSSDTKAEAARHAGADAVINYKSENVAERIAELTDGSGVDHLVEVNLSVNAATYPDIMANGGFVAVYGSDAMEAEVPAVMSLMKQLRYGFFLVYELPRETLAKATADLTALLEEGAITAVIHSSLPLDQIAEAHRLVESGEAQGNVVVTLN